MEIDELIILVRRPERKETECWLVCGESTVEFWGKNKMCISVYSHGFSKLHRVMMNLTPILFAVLVSCQKIHPFIDKTGSLCKDRYVFVKCNISCLCVIMSTVSFQLFSK